MKQQDLIVFGEDFGALPSSTQHLIKLLARDRKVLWVNSIGLRQPKLNLNDLGRLVNKVGGFAQNRLINNSRSSKQPPNNKIESIANIHVLNPITLPAPKSTHARAIAKAALTAQIIPAIKRLRLHKPILWISLPTAVDMVGQLGESACVYYCGDDFSALAGVDHETVAQREQELVNKADLILAASAELTKRFPAEKTHCIEHGVDLALFSEPCPRASDLPNDGKPIAGFYGSINKWLDIDLLANTAAKLPDWHFVFIGQCHIDVSRLSALANVQLLGAKPHQSLPSYSQHWTASLLPFVLNQQIQACNPLKLTEYMAAGKPVIATEFAASLQYTGFVQLVRNTADLVSALEACRTEAQSSGYCECIRARVAGKSWLQQSQRVNHLLDAL